MSSCQRHSTNTNPAIARLLGVPIVGCASHKFNLSVSEWINGDDDLVSALGSLAELMDKAANSKASALLRDLTREELGKELCVKQQCATRWTGTMDMIVRYFKIKPQLEKIRDLHTFILDKKTDEILAGVLPAFKVLRRATIELQHKGLSLKESRELFDIVLQDPRFRSSFMRHCGKSSSLVKYPAFEKGIIKIMNNERLKDDEEKAVKKLLIMTEEPEDEEDMDGLEEMLDHRAKLRAKEKLKEKHNVIGFGQKGNYLDPGKIICATSNCCERLFSEAKYILLPHRTVMSPILFEALLFLKKNKNLWALDEVARAMKMKPGDEDLVRDDDMFYETGGSSGSIDI